MNESFIMQMQPWFGEEEKSALSAYMDEGGFITEFKRTEKFEQLIAEYTGSKHCVVVNNGTVSLTLAALGFGIGPGDEVIVPNFTMIATPNSVKILGAEPIFVDVEPDTLCMDVELARAAITPRTKAIMLVAANGRYPKAGIEAFEALAKEHGLPLIEDAAQALGSHYEDGRHIGTVGSVGSFSFSAPKIISTGQGGCLVTNDDELAYRLRRLKDFGRSAGGSDVHPTIGYNFKFTELQACIGIEQMKKLPIRVKMKREMLRHYRSRLGSCSSLKLFDQNLEHGIPWFIDVLAENRDGLQAHLKDAGIGSRVMYPPINMQHAYSRPGHHPVSELVGQKGLWLPSSTQLTAQQIDRVCNAVLDFYS